MTDDDYYGPRARDRRAAGRPQNAPQIGARQFAESAALQDEANRTNTPVDVIRAARLIASHRKPGVG